jgi:hypothetical protein
VLSSADKSLLPSVDLVCLVVLGDKSPSFRASGNAASEEECLKLRLLDLLWRVGVRDTTLWFGTEAGERDVGGSFLLRCAGSGEPINVSVDDVTDGDWICFHNEVLMTTDRWWLGMTYALRLGHLFLL